MARARTTLKRVTTKKIAGPNWPQHNLRFDPDEFRKNLKIDKHALDEEIERQPEIYGEIADAAAQAKSQVEALEEELKELESHLDKTIRAKAAQDEEHYTETAFKAKVAGHPNRKKMAIKLLNAKDLQRRLDALQTAQRHKSYALRDMVDLYLSGYYDTHSAKGSKRDYTDAEYEKAEEEIAQRRATRGDERTSKRIKRHRKRP